MEVVNGTIIGEPTKEKPYGFFDKEGNPIATHKWFETDEEAIEWFKNGWPTAYKNGVEMRVYNV